MTRVALMLRSTWTGIVGLLIFAGSALLIDNFVANMTTNPYFRLHTLHQWFLAGFALIFIIFMFGFVCLAVVARSLVPLRMLRTLREGTSPPLPIQPGTEGALRQGEQLRVERTRSTRDAITALLGWLVALMGFPIFLEALLLGVFQEQNPTILDDLVNLSLQPFAVHSLWYWLPLTYLLFAFALGAPLIVQEVLSTRRWSLVADDDGLVLTTGRKRTNIRWGDISAVAVDRRRIIAGNLAGQYFIRTRDDRIIPLSVDPLPDQSDEAQRKIRYREGYAHYADGMLRFFATIRARSFATFHESTLNHVRLHRTGERVAAYGLRYADVFDAPVAPPGLQPPVITAPMLASDIKVIPRLRWRSIVRNGAIFDALILGLFTLLYFGSGQVISLSFSWSAFISPFDGLDPLVVFVLVLVLAFALILSLVAIGLLGSIGFLFAYAVQRTRFPRLTIKDDGIIQPRGESLTVIPWREMRAWVLFPATESRPYDNYALFFGDQGKVLWQAGASMQLAGRKVPGDRQAAFVERLREAHTVIAARTGLPLRIYAGADP